MDFTRQLDIFNPDRHGDTPISLIGAGSVGSMVAILLGKVGFKKIEVWDKDKVEPHNLPNQFFFLHSIGQPKVEALQNVVDEMTGVRIKIHKEHYKSQTLKGIVITALDSMKARKMVFDQFLKQSTTLGMIDPRMGGLDYRVYTIRPQEHAKWAWYPDEGAVQERCTEKSIIFNVSGIAALVVSSACKLASGQPYPNEVIGEYRNTSMISIEHEVHSERETVGNHTQTVR